jgi:hypothetical protein
MPALPLDGDDVPAACGHLAVVDGGSRAGGRGASRGHGCQAREERQDETDDEPRVSGWFLNAFHGTS